MASSLPAPRALLNTLLDTIAAIPLQNVVPRELAAPHLTARGDDVPSEANALRRVPIAHRHLIVTLHVLFPGLLLPALDLLDRGLVTRLVLDDPPRASEQGRSSPPCFFFLVRSAQPVASKRRRRRSGSGAALEGAAAAAGCAAGRTYMVRLTAWNCTCAAFAFSAFPPLPAQRPASAGEGREAGEREVLSTAAGPESYAIVGHGTEEASMPGNEASCSFGGMSIDGGLNNDEEIPVCKHLLACLLAERWSAALGHHIIERKVGREEMAGIVADI